MNPEESTLRSNSDYATSTSSPKPESQELCDYIVSHLDEAIEKGYVRVYYQPVIRTLSGKLCGFEALARWDDPVYGLLPPDDFIGVLEEQKLIHKLDCYIIREVCKQHQTCAQAGLPIVPASFNLSRLDFDLCDIFSYIEDTAREFEVPRRMLNIEITETVLGTDPAFMTMMVSRFHEVGYQVWMDDFGSGYSTLNALKDFEFDELKIDMEFLNRFGEKSKTILASVVDMAKKLGIQTLAEGVETEEHRKYLRRIGCEKMQGYLYGKPEPYSPEFAHKMVTNYGFETALERVYFNKIGSINTLSLSERDFSADNSTHDYVTSMPLALVEYENNKFKVIDSNRVFREGLENVGIPSVAKAESMINDPNSLVARTTRRLMDSIETEKYARQDYVVGDIACAMRIRHITTMAGKTALLVSIDDTIEQTERRRHGNMNEALSVLYSIYEHVDLLHLDEDYIEPVFNNANYHPAYDIPDIAKTMRLFAKSEIFPADQRRYTEFLQPDTMLERIRKSGQSYLVNFFRARTQGGNYAWKLIGLIDLGSRAENQVLLCTRDTHWANDALFQEAFDGHADDGWRNLQTPDMRLTDGSLWRAIARDEDIAFFWKDRDRRFLGANETFLEYYGLKSVDAILGKTDEDMGWHIDPLPYLDDEIRVLNEGYTTKDVPGQCIVRGKVRDIVASKRPIYRNGQIVGLVGYFMDAADRSTADDELGRVAIIDPITDSLNYTGLEAALSHYVDSYTRLGTDFGVISVDIDSFKRINDLFGYGFGDKVLRRVADEIRIAAGHGSVLGHVYADRFVVLTQEVAGNALDSLCRAIESQLMSIAFIEETPCTVYAFSGSGKYSEVEDVEKLKQLSRQRLEQRKATERQTGEGRVRKG